MRKNRDDYDVTMDVEEVVEKPKKEKVVTKIVVIVDNLALRDAPNGNKIGIIPMGFNFIVDTKSAGGAEWGELEDGSGWINMNYTRKAD